MSQGRARRLQPHYLQADRTALIGIQSLLDYNPMNQTYSVNTLIELGRTMEEAQRAEVRAMQALAAARDAAVAAEWALHDGLLGAKEQVRAQYGQDSHAMQFLGLKRKSERRRRIVRRSAQAGS